MTVSITMERVPLTEDDDPTPDMIPPSSDVEYPCHTCGQEAGPYGGRGPKPKYCELHKRGKKTAPKARTSNTGMATDATEIIAQARGMLMLGVLLAGFTGTASGMAEREQRFRDSIYNALLTDPKLCQSILRMGSKTGHLAFYTAIGMDLAAIAPMAYMEYKLKMAQRDQEREEG